MIVQAPYDYIQDYYKNVIDKSARFPNETKRWLSFLNNVKGDHVLDIGCGPTLYDYIPHFGSSPKTCIGMDINHNTFEFLNCSMMPELLEAKKKVQEMGVDVQTICGDAFEELETMSAQFDCILAVGFLAGHHDGSNFFQLMQNIRRSLLPGGTLIKISWHNPLRTKKESQEKKDYGYESTEWVDPNTLVYDIEEAGFDKELELKISCNAALYSWDHIQACAFRKI